MNFLADVLVFDNGYRLVLVLYHVLYEVNLPVLSMRRDLL
jgi:hypothetical protein